MPAHSVLVINSTGNVVYSKYFSNTSHAKGQVNQDILDFEQLLYRHTFKVWANKTIPQVPQTLTIGDIHIVFQRIGELMLFVCGSDDIDEVILSELLDAFHHVLNELSGGKLTEQALMNPESYGKWIISVDEAVPQGILETTDPDLIGKLGKLRS